jgi:nucleoside 2-deoxyribosyltransferase
MSNLSWDEQNEWREAVKEWLSSRECDYKLVIVNPCDYYNFKEKRYKTDREIMEFDKYQVRTSDLIIVNYNAPNSIGTAVEIGLANELHKPIVGLNESKLYIHSWLVDMTDRMCETTDELLNYIYEFYLLA